MPHDDRGGDVPDGGEAVVMKRKIGELREGAPESRRQGGLEKNDGQPIHRSPLLQKKGV